MLLLSSLVVVASGSNPVMLWGKLPLFQMAMMLLYHLVTVHMLWHAPIYAWLLLVSGWARRAVFLWAALPPLAICIIEKIAFNSSHFAAMLGYRLGGPQAFHFKPSGNAPIHPMTHIPLAEFLTTPGLWIGLLFAAIFLAAAVRLRRSRGPI
jgi:ABC-2 type transport system permease protein